MSDLDTEYQRAIDETFNFVLANTVHIAGILKSTGDIAGANALCVLIETIEQAVANGIATAMIANLNEK